MTIADKVESTRVIPLTPYMAQLLAGLPRATGKDGKANPHVFSSPVSASGRIAEPRAPHADVLADAGISHVSIHGLRRTFSLLGEAAGAPAGAIAQVMGHKPSALAEGYRPRSIDALRPYLAQIEAFILDRAGIAVSGWRTRLENVDGVGDDGVHQGIRWTPWNTPSALGGATLMS